MQKRITKDTIAYHIENENGDLYWSLTPPDYVRTRLVQKMTLSALVSLLEGRGDTKSASYQILKALV